MGKNRLGIIALIVSLLLIIPLVAMQFTNEVNWSTLDFVLAAALLFGAGLAIVFIENKVKNRVYKIALFIAVFAILLLVWAEFAVGIFG